MFAEHHPAGFGLACLIMMWALTLAAAAVRLVRASVPELAAGAVFIGKLAFWLSPLDRGVTGQ